MVIRTVAAVVALSLCAGPGFVHADGAKLAAARDAIDSVRYDDAQVLITAALAGGDLSVAETGEAYRLLGNTLVVLGKATEAEQAYRRWLSIDPAGELPTTAPAKQQRPFQAARAYIREHGALRVTVSRTATTVDVVIDNDPVPIAHAVSSDHGERVPFAGKRAVSLPIAATVFARVSLRDEHGNALLDVAVPVAGAPASSGANVDVGGSDTTPSVPILRRWPVWAVSAVVLGAAGAYFVVDGRDAREELRTIMGTHGEFFAADAAAASDRLSRDRIAAGLLFGAGAACAVTAGIMLATRPSMRLRITPVASPGAVGVVLRSQF